MNKPTPIPSYDQLARSALDSLSDAGELLDHLTDDPHAAFLAGLLVQGAQVYATLAAAEATRDDMREGIKRFPGRPTRPLGPVSPVRPVTPINNKFRQED